MYKAVVILFVVCFGIYILFTRTPDFFESETFHGWIIKQENKTNHLDSVTYLYYRFGSDTVKVPLTDWYRGQVHHMQNVPVIYDPARPEVAAVYSFFGYWIKLKELIVSGVVFILLFLAAVFITGKNPNTPYTAEELQKKRKYKD